MGKKSNRSFPSEETWVNKKNMLAQPHQNTEKSESKS